MTKFASASDKGYEDVSGEIFRWVKALRTPVGHLSLDVQECLKSLDHEDLNARQENVKDALTETFEWIWDRPGIPFSDWFLSSGGLLWISGKPGSGRSTIMKYLSSSRQRFHDLARQTQGHSRGAQLVIATYFLYFKGSALARSVEGMMRPLLHQILKQLPQLHKAVLLHFEEIRRTRKEFAWRRSDLERAFQRVMQFDSNFRFLVLVDALDEYQGEEIRLAEFLTALSETYPHKLHIYVSSRPSAELKDQLRSYPNIRMEDKTAQDIQHYVAVRFHNMLSGNKSFQKLADSVIRAAEGVFVWVKLVCDELLRAWRRGEDPARLDQRLQAMPKELDAFYQRILDALDAEDREEARLMLSIVTSAVGPLRPIELREWLGHGLNRSDLVDEISTLVTVLEYVLSINLELCAKDLLSLSPSDHPEVAVTDVDSNGGRLLFAVARGGNSELAQTLFDKGATISRSLPYAWSALVRAIHSKHPVLAQLFLQHGADPNEPAKIFLQPGPHKSEFRRFFKDWGNPPLRAHSPLKVVVESAQPVMLQILADWGADLNATIDMMSGTALRIAANREDCELLKALLDAGADVNFAGPVYGNALEEALLGWRVGSHGSLPAIILLLQRGADPNSKSVSNGYPHIWNEIMNDDIMRVSKLLEYGANAKAVDPQGHGLLYWVLAVHSRSSLSNAGAIGQILLQHGAILSPQDLVELASAGVLPQTSTSPFDHKRAFEELLKLANGDTLKPLLQRLLQSYRHVERFPTR
ncbi:hypothetical protein H2199_007570 [Coniosporium tulheliwenetii]|uniref:Uncharacterized protein n=1 Tax=Coniosporium tulheliwenetii TaxID=3383036 RepID=A0ACC2YPR6_9PEZI|nr:hypothetical protein H2199_007570 [Cladosporium sp. JES 115]